MAPSTASSVLLASLEDVWSYLAEPYNLADWWPGVAAVEPDRRGFARGARWRVRASEPSLLRRADEDTLLVTEVEPASRFAFELVRARTRVTLDLSPAEGKHTLAELRIDEPFSFGFSRGRRAKEALARLHDLLQTGATV
jgi:uncharacterized protein YndB with AHSA1/START domain